MTPAALSAAVLEATRAVFAARGLDQNMLPSATPVERPRNPEHGDYATNVVMQVAKKAGVPPRELAEAIVAVLSQVSGVVRVDIAGPGFLNITLDAAAQGELARTIVTAGNSYGRNDALAGQKINLEFVSANPTGPVHIGGVRWAAMGDALARLFEVSGAEVVREYYFNDHGSQIDRFARSLLAAAKNEPTPEDGYAGSYIGDIAAQVLTLAPTALDRPDEQAQEVFRRLGVELMFEEVKRSLKEFGVVFDVFFHENSLHSSGAVATAIETLRGQGHVYDQDGAVWLRTTDFGDDKDRVLLKSDGEAAYFAGDAAYYLDKRERGFDVCVYLLGADHAGYVGRLKALAACAGDDSEHNIQILIGQMVNLLSGGEPVRMSKRAGNVVTLADLVEAIGVDAARYALVRSSLHQTIDIDMELWTRKSSDNPIFYVQYAHSRICTMMRGATALGIDRGEFRPELLTHDLETTLLGLLGELPRVVAAAAELREPHRVAHYLESVAGALHRFYDHKPYLRVLPKGDEETTDTHRARLWLCEATRTVLVNGLNLLGVGAPEQM